MQKSTLVSILIAGALIAGAYYVTTSGPSRQSGGSIDNVTMEAGRQIVAIGVKRGYTPQNTLAKAGVPTILRLTTSGSFDCSSGVRIPSMGIVKNLPPTGTTDVDLGTPEAGRLQGVCGMGMYSFAVDFAK